MRPLLLIFMLLISHCYGQTISQKFYSYNDGMYGDDILQTDDGGFIICGDGLNKISIFSSYKTLIMKTDSLGNIIWSYAYGGAQQDIIRKLKHTSDNNYAGIGGTTSFGPIGIENTYDTIKLNINVLKIDTLGNVLWSRVFGDTLEDFGTDFVESTSGDMVITGRAKNYPYTGVSDNRGDILLMCLDKDGNLKWCKTIESVDTLSEMGYNIANAPDGGYYISGSILDTTTSTTDVFLLKTDSLGNVIWSKRMAEPRTYDYVKMTSDFNGGVLLGYTSYKYDFLNGDLFLVDFDSNGTVVWSNKYGSTANGADDITALYACWDSSGYVFNGLGLVKIDKTGNIIWSHLSSSGFLNGVTNIIEKKDFGFIFTGVTSFNNSSKMILIQIDSMGNNCGNTAINYPFQSIAIQPINFPVIVNPFIVEIDSGGLQFSATIDDSLNCQVFTSTNELAIQNKTVIVFPNPFSDQLNIDCPVHNNIFSIEIFDSYNRLVYQSEKYNTSLKLGYLNPGIYFIRIFTNESTYLYKIVKI